MSALMNNSTKIRSKQLPMPPIKKITNIDTLTMSTERLNLSLEIESTDLKNLCSNELTSQSKVDASNLEILNKIGSDSIDVNSMVHVLEPSKSIKPKKSLSKKQIKQKNKATKKLSELYREKEKIDKKIIKLELKYYNPKIINSSSSSSNSSISTSSTSSSSSSSLSSD